MKKKKKNVLAAKIKKVSAFFFVLICFSPFLSQNISSAEKEKVYIIPVSGMVEPGMAAYIKRSLSDIKEKKNAIFIFKLDTFGGRVDSALDIVDTISNISGGKTIAFVEKRAISAGALIALSANKLFMKNNTIIGDCAPMINTKEGQKMAGEKVQTVLRAKFRSLAKKNNYPEKLAQAMVTMDMEVYKVTIDNKEIFIDKKEYDDLKEKKQKIHNKKTIVAKGELLTMDDTEALELGFSQKSVTNIKDILEILNYESSEIIEIVETWSESFVRFLQPFLSILMLIGVAAVYTEIKAPGFGLPGTIGIICLGLVFFNQYLVGLANYTELLLMLIGMLLLGIEVFVLPGIGVSGFTGLLLIGIGLILSLQDFVIPNPDLPWEGKLLIKNISQVVTSFMLAFFVSLFMLRFVLPRFAKVIKGTYLEADLKNSQININYGLKSGHTGIAHTALRPSGKIIINNKKFDAIAQGDFIEAKEKIIINKIDQNRIIIDKLS